jgi:hypothetical protein
VNTLVARLSTDHAVHELVREGSTYILKTYVEAPSCERELTVREAGEWVETTRRCGGQSFARLGESLTVPERTKP